MLEIHVLLTFSLFFKKDKHLFTLWPKADKNGNTASVSTCLTWTSTYSLSKITKQPSKGSKLCIIEKFIKNTYSSCSCSCFIISATRLKIALVIMYMNHITPCSVTRMYITSSNTKHLKFPWKLTTKYICVKISISAFLVAKLTLKFCQFLWDCPSWFFGFIVVIINSTSVWLVLFPRTGVKLNLKHVKGSTVNNQPKLNL